MGGLFSYDIAAILSRTEVLPDDKMAEAQADIAEKLPFYNYDFWARVSKQGDQCDYVPSPFDDAKMLQ